MGIAAAIVSFLFCLAAPSFAVESPAIHLDGLHRFSAGDDLQWALPEYDDSGWSSIRVPGSWQCQSVDPPDGMGWYRIHFLVPGGFRDAHCAIILGRIGNADETYLNGKKIGGEGIIGDGFVGAQWKQRIYRVPEGLLRPGATNVLAVRVHNTFKEGGFIDGPISIGDYGSLLAAASHRESARSAGEAALIVLLFVVFGGSLLLYARERREREYLAFAVFIFLYGSCLTLDGLLFYQTGLKAPWVQRIVHTFAFVIPAAVFYFVFSFNGETRKWTFRTIASILGALALLLWMAPGAHLFPMFFKSYLLTGTVTCGIFLFHAIRGCFRKINEAGYMVAGLVALIADGLTHTVGVTVLRIPNPVEFDWGVLCFLLTGMLGLIVRHGRFKNELGVLSGKILDAHEEERRRLSREIHDGVSQSLHAVKLHLQIMETRESRRNPSEIQEQLLPGVISEISKSIEELRSVATELRPAYLEEAALVEAFKCFADRLSERLGIQIRVEGDETIDVPVKIKDHLYRIYQEALINVVKYAQAGLILVALERKGSVLSVNISDNGKGFDLSVAKAESRGLGLSTMKERVKLLEGTFRIESKAGSGTRIHIEVPIP